MLSVKVYGFGSAERLSEKRVKIVSPRMLFWLHDLQYKNTGPNGIRPIMLRVIKLSIIVQFFQNSDQIILLM